MCSSDLYEDATTGERGVIPTDIVILSLGGRPDTRLYDQIKDAYEHVELIGDAKHPGRVFSATRSGFDAAWVLE